MQKRDRQKVQPPPVRGPSSGVAPDPQKRCPVCGADVNRKSWAAVYCSDQCKDKAMLQRAAARAAEKPKERPIAAVPGSALAYGLAEGCKQHGGVRYAGVRIRNG